MNSFYGGPKGASFEIKKIFNNYEELKNWEEYYTPNLGDWVMISYLQESFDILQPYHSSLWQVSSKIDFPNWKQNSENIEINEGLFFRLINRGFGSNYNTTLVINGGSSTEGIT